MKVKRVEPTFEAIQWTGDNREDIHKFIGDKYEIAGDPANGTESRSLMLLDIGGKIESSFATTIPINGWLVKAALHDDHSWLESMTYESFKLRYEEVES